MRKANPTAQIQDMPRGCGWSDHHSEDGEQASAQGGAYEIGGPEAEVPFFFFIRNHLIRKSAWKSRKIKKKSKKHARLK